MCLVWTRLVTTPDPRRNGKNIKKTEVDWLLQQLEQKFHVVLTEAMATTCAHALNSLVTQTTEVLAPILQTIDQRIQELHSLRQNFAQLSGGGVPAMASSGPVGESTSSTSKWVEVPPMAGLGPVG